MPRLVIDLADDRPIFSLPRGVVQNVRSALPDGWAVTEVEAPASGKGDGGATASPAALAAVRDAEIYLGYGVPPDLLRAGASLRWVHSGAAGVRASLSSEMLERSVIFTNSAGIHGPPVAETVMSYLLYFARGLDVALAAQSRRTWAADTLGHSASPVRELGGSTVGVVGLGGIGREVARRARAMGARVVAMRRRPDASVDGAEGVELFSGDGALRQLLSLSHYVVLTLPETPRTRGLMGARELAWMREDGVLVNVSRGGLVEEGALVHALDARRLRGAALDVFTIEPLPPDHPLWDAPNLLITPHTSAYSQRFWEREEALILDNLNRYLEGRELRNVVDKHEGY
jgi:phosphoglycerate dehydrogenase-like enzyme